jgi:Protein of unknown function (DUF1822)
VAGDPLPEFSFPAFLKGVSYMTFTPDLFDPTQPDLTVSARLAAAAWQQSRSGGTPASSWNGYLNQLCLSAVLPWLQAGLPQAKVWTNPATLFSFWELVNGTAIVINNKRLVLIPSEALDTSELRVPQEWVDIPGWAVDYYVGVKVNPDESQVQPWGYCTHRQLKTQGTYDDRDRTYALSEDKLIGDLSLLWVTQQINPAEVTQVELPALPALPLVQANNLLERLGNPAILQPRLAVPFETWGALLEHGGWRQRLAEQRRSIPQQSIWHWLERGVDRLGQSLGWEQIQLQPSLAASRGDAVSPTTLLARQLTIASQPYELRIVPLGQADSRVWRFELRSLSVGGLVPAGFKLKLLTEDLRSFEGSEDSASTAIEQLYVEVALEPGEGIVWEIEPIPEAFDREILRF